MRDGWIVIPPGGALTLHVDVLQNPSIEQMNDFVARVRGQMLSVAWSLEAQITATIVMYAGSTDRDRSTFMHEEIVSELQFGRKAKLIKMIAARLDEFDSKAFNELLDGTIRRRNALAHGQANLVPVSSRLDGICDGFSAQLQHKSGLWAMDDVLAKTWLDDAHQALEMANALTGLVTSVLQPQQS